VWELGGLGIVAGLFALDELVHHAALGIDAHRQRRDVRQEVSVTSPLRKTENRRERRNDSRRLWTGILGG